MIIERVIEIAEHISGLQRGAEILDAENVGIGWDQEHSDPFVEHLRAPLQVPWMYSRMT